MPSLIYKLLADDLAQNLDRFIDLVAERTMAELPELTDDAERMAFARTGARALMTDFIATLDLGVVEAGFHAPAAAIAMAQRFAQEGIPIDALLRAYRLGQELVFERGARLAEQIPEVDQRSPAVAEMGALSFRYMDGVMSDMSRAYETERERAFSGRDARRLALIRDLLAGVTVDPGEAERVLGHRVDGHHQAVVAWSTGREGAGDVLTSAAHDVAEVLGAELGDGLDGGLGDGLRAMQGEARSLVVADPSGDVTVWIKPAAGADDRSRLEQEAAKLREQQIQVAIGQPGRGLRGLATTKRQADLARSVAQLHPNNPITHYTDVALAAVLLRDDDTARSFAAEELGRLAHTTHAAAVLRTTLTAFYAAGQDQSRTARELGLHRNTIANRLRRAEDLLGHRTDERVRETEAALVIVEALPGERVGR